MPWELKNDRPIYAQLIEQIELKICSGLYAGIKASLGPRPRTGSFG